MTSVRRLSGVLFIGLLFTASAAMAADIVQFQLTGSSGYSLPPTDQQVYPYTALINGTSVETVSCDDFYHSAGIGDSFSAYRTYLSSLDLSATRFGGQSGSLQLYQLMAYLDREYSTAGSQLAEGEINWAIWVLSSNFIGTPIASFSSLDPGAQSAINAYIADAELHYLDGPTPAWKDLVIYTPVGTNDQEVIEVVTPEPGTMLLLGSGIVGLWSQRKRIF